MTPAPAIVNATKPQSGFAPTRKAPDPPVVPTSAREWPANDWPRMTVKTPTTADTSATRPPTTRATRTGPLEKKPGSTMPLRIVPTIGHLGPRSGRTRSFSGSR